MRLSKGYIVETVKRALEEDGAYKDVTTTTVVPDTATAVAHIICEEEAVLCGIDFAEQAFLLLDPDAGFVRYAVDGETIRAGEVVAEVAGRARAVLSAERTALNFLMHLSGIATATAGFVAEARKSGIEVYDTRKTHPLLRLAEKYAFATGGGKNHRTDLTQAIFLKDNHYICAGGFSVAVKRAAGRHPLIIEVESVEQALEAQKAGADVILCDNMSLADLKTVASTVTGAEVEASGGITPEMLPEIGRAGIKRVSVSSPIMKASARSFKLEIKESNEDI